MIKKVITTLLFTLGLPALAFAAFDDAQLTTGTTLVLSVGGNNLEFTVTSGNLETVTVDSGSVTLVLATGGSGVTNTSANNSTYNYGAPASMTTEFVCNSGSSVMNLGGSGTITLTPTGTACVSSAGQEHGSGGSGDVSAGGGGGSSSSSAPSSPAPEPTPTPAPEPVSVPAPVAAVVEVMTPVVVAQPSVVASIVSPVFNKDLQLGSRSADVKRLQELLAQDKDIYPNGLATGYFGKMTSDAIRKFQLKHGVIKKASDPGNGKLGPKTRAKLKEIFGKGVPASSPAPVSNPAPAASSVSPNQSMQDQLQALLKQLQELQAKAKKP